MSRVIFKNLTINEAVTDVVCENGKITAVGKTDETGIDFHGKKAYPGLIDIHTHGADGIDTLDCELDKLSAFQARHGITAFYPTTMTVSHERIANVLNTPTDNLPGAQIPGIHLEGPYINEKYMGAQNSKYIRLPDPDEFKDFDNVKIVTLAPELEGSEEYIKKTNAVIAVGHTNADYDTVMKAAKAGANCVTHTCNAMPPLHHREPSVIGAAFDSNMYAQVICDGIHIHPSMIRILYKLFSSDRMILISDSMRATGLPDGDYEFGGQTVTVRDKVARTQSGAIAGSTSTLFDCVQCAIKFGIPEAEAYKMASETPAKLMGLNKGKIEPGFDCDLIILNGNELDTVIIGGEIKGGAL